MHGSILIIKELAKMFLVIVSHIENVNVK